LIEDTGKEEAQAKHEITLNPIPIITVPLIGE